MAVLAGIWSMLRRRWWALSPVAVVGVAGVLAWPQAGAWYHFRAGCADLDRYHADDARRHFAVCLQTWPESAETHLLAARAARRAAAFEEARDQLRECQRLQKTPSDETALEWSLFHAAGGDLHDVEDFLYDFARRHPDRAPLVWEALTEGYLRVYRVVDALSVLQKWLEARPDDVQAHALRGEVYWTVNALGKSADDYRRVVELDSDRPEARWRLGVSLLEIGRYDEALPHLEEVRKQRPDDPDAQVRIARCLFGSDKRQRALEAVKAVVAAHPDYAPALRLRADLAKQAGNLDEAIGWLRDAVRASPRDYQANYDLGQLLQAAGREADAKEQLERAQKIKDVQERLGEIKTREMSMRPRDPALHAELGRLLMENGNAEVGARWLESAVRLDPGRRDVHRQLADFYQAQGDSEKAEPHRQAAGPSPSGDPPPKE
jgi:tetratricopeptide (TPR) repeat protein